MSANTPLMSEYPVDVKEPVDSALPIYRINDDAEELTVGGPARRQCFWSRFCHRRRAACAAREGEPKKRRSCFRRLVRWFMTVFLLFSVAGFFMVKHKMNCMVKHHPITCVPLEHAGSNDITLPLANFHTHVGLHNSLNGGDIRITHSDDVKEGTVSIQFDVPADIKLNDDEEVPEYYVCNVTGPKLVGVGLHSKDKKAQRVKATSTTITLSSKEAGHSRAVNIMGPRPRFHHRHGHFFQKLHSKFGMHQRIHKGIRKAIRKAVREAADLAAWSKIEHADVE